MSSGTSWHRNQQPSEIRNEEELLVFGYSCKIFRDDEKATFIDEGKHLIPWMGDKTLMIDRYDVRGYLHDLSPHEAKPHYELDKRTIDEEALCDEERYLALRSNLSEEELYHEEELKRLRAALASDGAYHEIGFSYEATDNSEGELQTCANKEEPAEDPYTAPNGLTIPKGMQVPSNMKIHAIIEKTACFIAQQGGQMEIIIKMKQSDNPQFAFMNFDNPLQPYYKFLVQELKAGRYKPLPDKPKEVDDDHYDGHYLHPSLVSKTTEDIPKFTVPSISFRRTGDDSYSLLVKNLKQRISEDIQRNSPTADINTASPARINDRNVSSESDVSDSEDESCIVTPPIELKPIIDKMAEYVAKNGEDFETIVKTKADKRFDFLNKGHKYYNYYISQRQAASRRQEPKVAPTPVAKIAEQKPILSSSSPMPSTSHVYTPSPVSVSYDSPEYPKITSSISESDNRSQIKICSSAHETPETQSPNSSHSYEPDTTEITMSPSSDILAKESSKTKTKVMKGPISFSLKAGEQTTEKSTRRGTLLLDDSEDEGDEENPDSTKKNRGSKDRDSLISNRRSTHTVEVEEKPRKTPQELEEKLAEDKLKDKLMAAAREKLIQQKRMQQLQQERKQKAALFLEMLRKKKLKSEADALKSSKNGDASDSSSSYEATPPDKNEPISSFPPSPISVFCQSGHWSGSDGETSTKTNERLQVTQSSSTVKKESKAKDKASSHDKSHKSHKSSKKSKKRKRARSHSRSRTHKSERLQSPSHKEKKLPAAYALCQKTRSRSRSPKHRNLHSRSRSPLYYWARHRP